MQFANFVGPAYRTRSLNANCEACINLYLERMGSAANSPAQLYSCPGFRTFASATESPGRNIWAQNGRCFEVVGAILYELMSDGSLTDRGTVGSDANPATFASNGDAGGQLAICSGDQLHILDLGSNVLTTSLTSGATVVAYIGGYFLVLDAATSTLRVSDLLDGTSFNPANVAQRLQGSDRWVALSVNQVGGLIYLIGSQTSEVWTPDPSAGSGVPFAPIAGGFLSHGTSAPFSVTNVGGSLVWVEENAQGSRMVVRSPEGSVALEKISTDAIDFALQGYATVTDAVGWSYQDQGHQFYLVTFPSANVTWCFDATEQLWHQRGFWNGPQNRFDAYRPMFHAYAFNKHLVLDRSTGNTYEASTTLYTDVDGTGIRRLRRAQVLTGEDGGRFDRYTFFPTFQITQETGVGIETGQGSDPMVAMRYSNDAGHTFVGPILTPMGKQGQYNARVFWTPTGAARGGRRVFEAFVSDPVPWSILGADLPGAYRAVS